MSIPLLKVIRDRKKFSIEEKNFISKHRLHEESYIFMPTPELRYKEDIVLELFREIFFKKEFFPGVANNTTRLRKPINPENDFYSNEEKALISAFKSKTLFGSNDERYIPVYPQIARGGKFRAQSARIINGYFFNAIIRHLDNICKGNHSLFVKMRRDFFVNLESALIGSKTISNNESGNTDTELFSLFVDYNEASGRLSKEDFGERISSFEIKETYDIQGDKLAERIYKDSLVIIELEKVLDRLEWINTLMTFLRIVIPIWMLANTRFLVLTHEALFNSFISRKEIDIEVVLHKAKNRHKGLLIPSSTPSYLGKDIIEDYVRRRIELDILLHILEELSPECKNTFLKHKRLTISVNSNDSMTILGLNDLIKKNEAKICQELGIQALHELPRYIQEQAYLIDSWINPLKGIGQLFFELLGLCRYSDGDQTDEGGILKATRFNNQKKIRGYKIIPGQLVIKLMVYLLSKEEEKDSQDTPPLTLDKLINFFEQYGIGYSYSDDARKVLIDSLTEMGLLKGSPDAGGAAQIINYYLIKQKTT